MLTKNFTSFIFGIFIILLVNCFQSSFCFAKESNENALQFVQSKIDQKLLQLNGETTPDDVIKLFSKDDLIKKTKENIESLHYKKNHDDYYLNFYFKNNHLKNMIVDLSEDKMDQAPAFHNNVEASLAVS